jgi:photosystem II stability/assembly factor-like uncharacterized protein
VFSALWYLPWTALVLATGMPLQAASSNSDYALLMPKARTSLLLDIAAAGTRLVEVGERGHVLYSDDGGETWVQVRVPTSVMLTRVFFVAEATGWAVGHDGNILLSNDGGVTWTLQRDGVSDQVGINEQRVARARAEVSDLETELAALSPGFPPEREDELLDTLEAARSALETALEVMAEPVYAPPLMDIWFANQEQGWAAGAFGTLLRTSNGGRSWADSSHSLQNTDELHLNGVAGDASGTLYLSSEWGYVFRSTSSGESWEAVATGFEGSYFGILVNPVSGSVFAYGLLGTIYRSTDRGQTWEPLDSKTGDSLFGADSAADGTLVFVGENGTAVRTDDDGDSFTVLHSGTGRGLYGVTAYGEGLFVATGEGGSVLLPGTAESRR